MIECGCNWSEIFNVILKHSILIVRKSIFLEMYTNDFRM